MKKLNLEIDGRQVEARVAQAKGVLWVHMDGETFTYAPEQKRGRKGARGGASGSSPNEITAPMPGKIIKILIKAGEAVKTHQVLLVMEAMKMEYTLKAQGDGKVAEVRCNPGDQVALGHLLIKLETA